MSLLSLLLLLTLATATLMDDRMETARVWILRSTDQTSMQLAYSDTYTTADITHTVRDVGDYGPKQIALEYDSLVIDLALFVGYNPYVLTPHWDPTTTQWIDANTLRVDFTIDIKAGFDLTTQSYIIDQYGFRDTEYIVFEQGTARMNLGYTVQDPAAIKAIATQDSITTNDYICNSIIIPACNGSEALGTRAYLADTGFTSGQQCLDFLNSLPPNNPCPFVRRSNTPECRNLHGFSSFLAPEVHCAHVRPVSEVCTDSCLPACANCHHDAECVANFPTFGVPVFACQCKNGFVGDGLTCAPKPCNYKQCPAQYGSYNCDTGLCICSDGWQANPQSTGSQDLCTCPDGGQVIYVNASTAVCVPRGRCIDQQWQCTNQTYSQVKCTAVANTFTPFRACLCNYGFEGGWEYPCVCPAGKRVVWSDAVDGDVCLAANECTTAWHCNYPQHCSIGTSSPIGTCVA